MSSESMTASLPIVRSLIGRSMNELFRVPGAAIPGVLAPTIFFLGLTAVFGNLALLPGFEADRYQSFIIPVSMMQGAAFTGAATGVNLARDIEQGWFDRLLASPAPRPVILAGLVYSASLRALIPGTVVLCVGLAIGVHWPGILGVLIAAVMIMGLAATAATWGATLAFKFRTQSAAPLMQAGTLVAVLTTTAYAPLPLLTGWLKVVATYNPLTQVLQAIRQGFVAEVTWAHTWPGLVALVALWAFFSFLALRGMSRMTD